MAAVSSAERVPRCTICYWCVFYAVKTVWDIVLFGATLLLQPTAIAIARSLAYNA